MSLPVSRNSETSIYLRAYKITKKDKGKVVTHRLLSGGNVSLPYAQFFDLFSKLELDWRNKRRNYIVEQKTPIFKLILDLDFQTNTALEQKYWLELVGHIQFVVQEFGVPPPLLCYVANADAVQLANGEWKNGCHLYWPTVLVDQKTALTMRWAIVQHFEEIDKTQDWKKIVDASVLKANGMRYLFCNKGMPCPACQNKKEEEKKACGECSGAWYIDTGRPYTPRCVVNADGSVNDAETARFCYDLRHALQMTSCVTELQAMPVLYRTPDWVHDQPPEASVSQAGSTKQPRTKVAEPINGGTGFTKKLDGREIVFEQFENPPIQQAIVTFLNTSCSLIGPHQQQGMRKLLKDQRGIAYMVIGTNKFCNNVHRCHNGEDIYYVITKDGITQFCWSTNHGCRTFMSERSPITPTLAHILFSEELQGDNSDLAIGALQSWASHQALNHMRQTEVDMFVMARALYPLLSLARDDPLYDIAMHFDDIDEERGISMATFDFPMQ
jgi:hypothetical protein